MLGLLFDLDGTLALTNPVHERAWRQVLSSHGVSLSPETFSSHISGRSNPEIVSGLLPRLSVDEGLQLADFKEEMFRNLASELDVPVGLTALVQRAEVAGCKLAVVTNAPSANAVHVLQRLGLQGTFSLILGAEHVTRPKPDAEPYEAAARQLGLAPSQCIAFEDSPSGVKAAVAAGVPVAGMLTSHTASELIGAGADVVSGDFADPGLLAWVERFLVR